VFTARFPSLDIQSAGLRASLGHLAHPFAIQTCASNGIDIGSHRSKPISADLLKHADLVLTMEAAQMDHVLRAYPWCTGKVRTFASPPLRDLPDLLGEPLEAYERFHAQAVDSSRYWSTFLDRSTSGS